MWVTLVMVISQGAGASASIARFRFGGPVISLVQLSDSSLFVNKSAGYCFDIANPFRIGPSGDRYGLLHAQRLAVSSRFFSSLHASGASSIIFSNALAVQ